MYNPKQKAHLLVVRLTKEASLIEIENIAKINRMCEPNMTIELAIKEHKYEAEVSEEIHKLYR